MTRFARIMSQMTEAETERPTAPLATDACLLLKQVAKCGIFFLIGACLYERCQMKVVIFSNYSRRLCCGNATSMLVGIVGLSEAARSPELSSFLVYGHGLCPRLV